MAADGAVAADGMVVEEAAGTAVAVDGITNTVESSLIWLHGIYLNAGQIPFLPFCGVKIFPAGISFAYHSR